MTVALNKDAYTRNMESILSDRYTYTEIKKNPLSQLQNVLTDY